MANDFTFDNLAVPATKVDGGTSALPANQVVTAAEFNTLVSAVTSLRNAVTTGLYHGLSDNAAAPQSSTGTVVTRYTGGLLQHSVNGGRFETLKQTDSKIYNVLDYGAKGDGVTDDTTAIQAAINAAGANTGSAGVGGYVYLPAGKFKITRTLFIKDMMNFRFCGASKGLTRIVWAGTNCVPRWAASTAYATGALMYNRGFVYQARTGGTSGAAPPTTTTTGAGGYTDGSVVWDFLRVDDSTAMIRVESYFHLEIHDMELTGFASTTDQTKRPVAMILSFINGANRTYSPSGLIIKRVRFNQANNSGLPNMADNGVQWDWGNNEFNNSEGYLEDLNFGCCGNAILIDGSQSQDHTFVKMGVENSCGTAIRTYNGSFRCFNSNLNCTPGTGTVIVLGQSNDRVAIDNCITEDAGRWLTTGGSPTAPSYFGSPWGVSITNCRFACNNLAADGKIIVFTFRGPLIVRGNVIESGVNGIIPKFSLGSSGRAWRATVTDNVFNTHWPNNGWTATTTPICDGAGAGCVESGNEYINYTLSTGADTVMRSEAGTIVIGAPVAWAQSTFYPNTATTQNPSLVIANGALYQSYTYPSGGTSAATGTGPTGQEEQNGFILDGTAHWTRVSDPVSPVLNGTQYYFRHEVPMPGTYHVIDPVITTRTGTSAQSVQIMGVAKYKHGFTLTLSSALTGTDTITVDWSIRWP